MIEPQKIIYGLTVKELFFKCLKMFGVLLFIFYYTYPQALDFFGRSSFIVPAATVGISLYAWNRFPFVEVAKVILFFMGFLFFGFFSEYMSNNPDSFRMSYIRSQMAFFFSAYFAIFLVFNVHKNPRFEIVVGYIIAAVGLQCLITLAINQYEWADTFFYSLQMKEIYTEELKDMTEDQRLIGYGTAFFGAGMVAGYALIMIAYLVAVLKLNKLQIALFAILLAFIFFIGLFSARTTTIGLGIAAGLYFLLYFIDKRPNKKQFKFFILFSILIIFIGAGVATQLFPLYTEWAYEMFDNFMATGKFSTDSSDALYSLFNYPKTTKGLLIGTGKMEFFGNDMGITRILYYVGVIGLLLFFGYQYYVASFCITKDLSANILVLTIVAYSFALNIKGLTDLNPVLYLFFFYFLFYKYYRYFPSLYSQRLIQRRENQMMQLQDQNDTQNHE